MGLIIVGLDGSAHAPAVLQAAAAIARSGGHKLVLFQSCGIPKDLPPGVWKLEEGSLIEHIRGHSKDYLNDCARTVPAELLYEVRVEVGVPWQAICTVAKGMNAELVVVGSHGHGMVDRLLGTTATKIVNHAECSVLVVKARPAEAEAPAPAK